MGLVAMREDEDKAATVGIDTPVYKLLGFVASAVFVGMAGAVYGYYLSFVDPLGMFNILLSVQILLSMLLGGRGTLWGPVLGAFLIEPLNEFANNELGGGNARLLVFGGLMALVVLFLPRGILPVGAPSGSRRAARAARQGWSAPGSSCASARRRPSGRRSGRRCSRCTGWRSSFGGLRAVDGCSFEVPEGSITALIGPNGSGKTTVFNLIGGTMRPDAGEVWFDGERIDGLRSWRRAYRGHRPHLPDHAPVPGDDRAGERGGAAARVPLRAAQRRRRERPRGRSGPRSCSTSSACARSAISARRRSPTASRSSSSWRRSSCSTRS